jgi:hypothetical protein
MDDFTNLLKDYGNVEAKNVFYWFRNNHTRNKRKQEKETHADNKRMKTNLQLQKNELIEERK